jgi:excisionase family DNA binding protein
VTEPQPELLTMSQVAAMLACSTKTVNRIVERGELKPVRIDRHLRFRRQSVIDLIDRKTYD